MVKDKYHPLQQRRSARTIIALLDCSDNTAQKVATKIEFEKKN